MNLTHFGTMKSQVAEILSSGCTWCFLKVPLSFIGGIGLYLVGGGNVSAGIAIIVLVSIDLLTAIMAEYKNGNPIESRKALKTATKLVVYGLFLAAVHLTEAIVPGTTFLDEAVLSFLALTELISVMENIGKMGYPIPMLLLNRLKHWRDEEVIDDRRTGPDTRRDEIIIPK